MSADTTKPGQLTAAAFGSVPDSITQVQVLDTPFAKGFTKRAFVKQKDDTVLLAIIVGGHFLTAGAAAVTYYIFIDTTSTAVSHRADNELNSHKMHAGVNEITGVLAGAHTATLGWSAPGLGTTTIKTDDGDDEGIIIIEVEQ